MAVVVRCGSGGSMCRVAVIRKANRQNANRWNQTRQRREMPRRAVAVRYGDKNAVRPPTRCPSPQPRNVLNAGTVQPTGINKPVTGINPEGVAGNNGIRRHNHNNSNKPRKPTKRTKTVQQQEMVGELPAGRQVQPCQQQMEPKGVWEGNKSHVCEGRRGGVVLSVPSPRVASAVRRHGAHNVPAFKRARTMSMPRQTRVNKPTSYKTSQPVANQPATNQTAHA